MKYISFAIVWIFSFSASADATRLACLTKSPFLFGASITAGYGGLKDGAAARAAAAMSWPYFGSNVDPVTRLSRSLNKESAITNISEMINAMKFNAFGYLQIQDAILKPDLLKKMSNASIIASVDAFYWPMVFGRCQESFRNLDWMIGLARHLKKPMLLATVPIEDPNTVDRIVRMGWSEPEPVCTARFNQYMLETCLPQNDCYVADIAETVVRLNSTGIEFQGKLNKVHDFRFDGVHLTLAGNQWIQKLIVEALAKGTSSCQ